MQAAGRRYIIHGSRKNEFTLWFLSDLHVMNKACAEGQIKRDVKRILNDPNAFWIGGGDYCECIGHTDKRFDPDSVAPWVSVKDLGNIGKIGMTRVRNMLEPIKHKCLGLLKGNHEKHYEKIMTQDLHQWLCDELEVLNMEYCALFDVVFSRMSRVKTYLSTVKINGSSDTTFRVFAHHGAGAATTPGGKLNKLVQFMNSFDAQLFFLGHCHDQVGRREPVLGASADCSKLVHRDKLGVISGSYLRTYAEGVTTYGEQRGYRPVSLGAAWVKIKPETREMRGQV